MKKFGWVFYAIVPCALTYTNISAESFTILAFFLLMDTITGVVKVIATGGKPTSRRFIIGVLSKLLLLMVPLMISLLVKVVVPEWEVQKLLSTCIGMLSVAEFYSIIQNIVSIRIGREIEEYDAVSQVFVYILRYIRSIIEKNLPKQ